MSQLTKGYQMPAGDAFEEDLCCAIVFYPDRDEYRRALLGSLTYFATWIAWEKDEAKRGKDAARAWQLALDKTLECWNMACMEDLITAMEDLLETFQTKKDCCDDNVTYTPGPAPTTEIEPGVGDPPATYGETSVADWDEWTEHLCYQAHVYVDNLISVATQLNEAVYPAWITIGLVAALLSVLTFSGIGIPIAFGLAATVVGSLVVLGSGAVFSGAATALEDARGDIVCALILGTDLATAVEDALTSGVAWDAFYSFIDYDAATAILYEGGGAGEYLDPQTRQDCDECGELPGTIHGWRGEIYSVVSDKNIINTRIGTPSSVVDSFICGAGAHIAMNGEDPWPLFIAIAESAALAEITDFDEFDCIKPDAARQEGREEILCITHNSNYGATNTTTVKIRNPQIWMSEDDGVSGTWVNATFVEISSGSEAGWTVESGNELWYSATAGAFDSRRVYVLMAQA